MLDLHRLRLLRELEAAARAGRPGRSATRPAPFAAAGRPRARGRHAPARARRPQRQAHRRRARAGPARTDAARRGSRPPRPRSPRSPRDRWPGVVRVAAFQSAFLRVIAPAIRELADPPAHQGRGREPEVEQAVPGAAPPAPRRGGGGRVRRPAAADPRRPGADRPGPRAGPPGDAGGHPLARRRKVPLTDLADKPGRPAIRAPATARCRSGSAGSSAVSSPTFGTPPTTS